MSAKSINRICYICGKLGADSKDHIPPKNIFLKEKRSRGLNLITVPAHTECNNKYQQDDDYFRLFLSVPGYWNSEDARKLWDREISKQFHSPKSAGFRNYIRKDMFPVELSSPSGIYMGLTMGKPFDSDRVNNVIKRITRGIYYKETKSILPLDWKFQVNLMGSEVVEMGKKIDNAKNWHSYANEAFKYVWNVTEEDSRFGAFWFVFFNCIDFWVLTYSEIDKVGS